MIFREQKKNNGYVYDLDDVFGSLHIESLDKLDAELLDNMVVILLRQNIKASEINGEVEHNGNPVRYSFKKAPMWEDKEEEKCENITTSIKEPEKEYIQTNHLKTRIYYWLQRLKEKFQKVWKSK